MTCACKCTQAIANVHQSADPATAKSTSERAKRRVLGSAAPSPTPLAPVLWRIFAFLAWLKPSTSRNSQGEKPAYQLMAEPTRMLPFAGRSVRLAF
jgi:hypothetical protein